MTIEQIQALLEEKFAGERKDGLKLLARYIGMTAGETDDEKAKAAVNELTKDGVQSFIKEWRKDADAETTKAVKTNEETLKTKFDFVEKGKPTTPPPVDDTPAGITAEQMKAAIAEAIKPYVDKVSQLEGAATSATRREQVESLFKDKQVNSAYKKAVMAGFEGKTFEDDAAFNTYLEATKADVDSCVQELANNGLAGMSAPILGQLNKDGVSADVAAYIENRQKAESGEAPLSGKKI